MSEASNTSTKRDIVFISHANPQDNDFTFWLGSRLNAAGYETWSDITRLKGGEYFWQDIQKVIQEKAAKVIVVMTKEAVTKDGVLDEIQTAINTERVLKQPTFLVPVVYKPFDFKKDSPVQVSRKNAINFKANWAEGLATLLERLEEDKVPKSENSNQVMSAWRDIFSEHNNIIKAEPEILQSNWFEIKSLPEQIMFYGIEGPTNTSKVPEFADAVSWPSYAFARLIAGFGDYQDFQDALNQMEIKIRTEYQIGIREFIDGNAEESPVLKGREARNIVSNLVTQAWNSFMRNKGLHSYALSNYSNVWWFPDEFEQKNKVHFHRIDGQRSWCQLVGKVRKYRWHFGLRARTVIRNDGSRLVIVPHVIFTTEDGAPIKNKDAMHRMRRSACKRWYNKVWRDRLTAAMTWLSCGKDIIFLPAGTDIYIGLSSLPYLMSSPVSINLDKTETELNTLDVDDEDVDSFLQEEDSVVDDSDEFEGDYVRFNKDE